MCQVVGKRGKKRSFRLKGKTANEWNDNRCRAAPVVWPNDARRRVVDTTTACLLRIVDLYRLLNLGGVSGGPLLFRQLHLAVLFAGAFRCFTAQLALTETRLVAGLVAFFPSVTNSVGAGRIPTHLLLLSRRLLQGVL